MRSLLKEAGVRRSDWKAVLDEVTPAALAYLGSLPSRRVFPPGGYEQVRAALDHGLTQRGVDPVEVVAQLASDLEPGVHSTVPRALRFLGLGERAAVFVPCDEQDRVRPDALAAALQSVSGPTIVAVEAGNVNTGAFDDFDSVADVVDGHRAAGTPPGPTSTAPSCSSRRHRRRWPR